MSLERLIFLCLEFNNRGVMPPEKLWGNIQKLMDVLEIIRAEYGKPIRITSGYRSQKYNDNLPQNKNKRKPTKSMHILCGGCDIKGVDGKVKEIGLIAKRLQDEGTIGGLGLGLYFVHIDLRNVISYANKYYRGFYNKMRSLKQWLRRSR